MAVRSIALAPGSRAALTLATLAALAIPLAATGAARADVACAPDDELAEAAADLLLGAGPLTPERVLTALRRSGSDLPFAHASVFDVDDVEGRGGWIADLVARADAPLVCGVADGADGRRITLAAARAGSLTRLAEAPDTFRPVLAPGFVSPYVVVLGADGVPTREPLDATDVTSGVRVPDLVPRPAMLQLVATGPAGPRPVAEREVGGAAAGSPAPVASPTPDEPGSSDATRLGELRRLADARPLRVNRLLVAVANRHAADVCRNGRVAHEIERGSGPEERLAREGVRARLVGEAIGRSRTTASALAALARSPSHRMTLLDDRFTDVGIGTARDATGRACLVIALAAWPRVIPP